MPHKSDAQNGVPLDDLMQTADTETKRFFVVEEPQKPKRKAKPNSPIRWLVIVLLVVILAQAGIIAFLLSRPAQEVIIPNAPAVVSVMPQQTSFTINVRMGSNSSPAGEKPVILMAKSIDSNGCPVELTTEFETTDQIYVTYQSPVQNQQSFWVQLSINKSGTFFEEVYRLFPAISAFQTYSNACISFGFEGSQFATGVYRAGVYRSDEPLGHVDFTLSD